MKTSRTWYYRARVREFITLGAVVGPYIVVKKLGQGGMGQVYLGQHKRLPRMAAIKVLNPEISGDSQIVERFFTEARATASISHPGIVEVFDCDVLNDQAYILMEYLAGETLAAFLERTGPMHDKLAMVCDIAAQVADAVGAAHARGIVHRDLKPENVFLMPQPNGAVHVKVVDFGIAKLLQDRGPRQTRTGMLLGTPAYMSPEQVRGAGQVDHRTDVYSLGCILYEMVAGTPPFVREGVGDVMIAHAAEPAPPLPTTGVPETFRDLVARMLAKAQADRPQSMAEVRAAALSIGGGLAPVGVALQPPVLPPRGEATAPQWAPTPGPAPPGAQGTPGPRGRTTFSGSSLEIPVVTPRRRWPLVVVPALALAGLAVALVMRTPPAPVGAPAAPAAGTALPAEKAAVPAAAAPARVEIADPSPGLTVSVDGVLSTPPLELARGGGTRTVVLKAPGKKPRTFTVDGSRDRVLDGALDPEAAPAPAPASSAAAPSAKPAKQQKPSKRAKPSSGKDTHDRDAIIDL
jgi:serine/threonine-protein kinase